MNVLYEQLRVKNDGAIMIRKASAADRFYTSNPIILREEIKTYLTDHEKRPAIAVVVPHAGYPYSGKTAGAAYSEVIIPDTVVVLGPNHSGTGAPFAIMSEGAWEMPFGDAQIDEDLAERIEDNCGIVENDPAAHQLEHSLEVQIPFLQQINPQTKIVPIAICSPDLKKLKQLGRAVAKSIKESGSETLIVASTDMSHTQSSSERKQKRIKKNDLAVLEKAAELDEDGFMGAVEELKLTMCGYAPVAATIVAAKKLGATRGSLVRYSTSYDISGDYSYVVGYAGMVIE